MVTGDEYSMNHGHLSSYEQTHVPVTTVSEPLAVTWSQSGEYPEPITLLDLDNQETSAVHKLLSEWKVKELQNIFDGASNL